VAGRVAVGLDIGTSGVRAAEMSFGRGLPTLTRFGQIALPDGAVRDGEVVDATAVASAIRQLWRSAKFSTKKVVLGVANQKVIVRQVDLPWMRLADLKHSLPFQVRELLPMPLEQAILDCHPVAELVGEGDARLLRVLLVAASRDMVASLLDAVKRAGLTASMIDLTPFAVVRAVAAADELGLDGSQAEAVVDVGARVTNIVVHEHGVPRFVRILLMGGAHITDAVAERMGVPLDQAEGVKQQVGMRAAADEPGAEHPAVRAVDVTAATLVEEIRASLDYYLAQPGATPITRVVLSGGGSRLENFTARLARSTRLPVVPAASFASLRVGKTGLTEEQLNYVEPVATVPVGLAMGAAS
jgi:type IV pilus assembly protein PilM